MASAQEFSSPGAHMASNSGSGGVTSSGTIWSPGTRVGPGRTDSGSSVGSRFNGNDGDSVIFNDIEPVDPSNYFDYSYINKMFEDSMERIGGFGSTGKDYSDYMEGMFGKYSAYNDDMFNRAKVYDEYMSNTAIQRQVEDLKKAGLNPILASHLGGASFAGVNPPYVSINPASGFSALTNFEGTKYASDSSRQTQLDVVKLQTASSEFIAQYNKTQEFFLQDDRQDFEAGMVKLKRDADEYLENLKYKNDKDLQHLGFINQMSLNSYIKQLNKSYNDWFFSDDSNYIKTIRANRLWQFFGQVVPSAISAGASMYNANVYAG